jgi:hypothetical protein
LEKPGIASGAGAQNGAIAQLWAGTGTDSE